MDTLFLIAKIDVFVICGAVLIWALYEMIKVDI